MDLLVVSTVRRRLPTDHLFLHPMDRPNTEHRHHLAIITMVLRLIKAPVVR